MDADDEVTQQAIATTADRGGNSSSSNNANNALDRNPPFMSEVRDSRIANNQGGTNSPTQ